MKAVAESDEMIVDVRYTRTTSEQQMLKKLVNSNSLNLFEVRTQLDKLTASMNTGEEARVVAGNVAREVAREVDGEVAGDVAGVQTRKEVGGEVKQGRGKKRKRKDRNNLWMDN